MIFSFSGTFIGRFPSDGSASMAEKGLNINEPVTKNIPSFKTAYTGTLVPQILLQITYLKPFSSYLNINEPITKKIPFFNPLGSRPTAALSLRNPM